MNEQRPLPELPPMTPAAASMAPPPAPPYAQPAKPAMGTRRLRQALTALVGGGALMTSGVLVLEVIAKPGFRPTDLMATIEAQTELGVMNQKLGVEPGKLVLTEADYKAKLAEAERSGQAKAELSFQQELAVVQADKERVVGAYQTLYQRTNLIAQAAIQLETVAQQFRQQLLEMTNGGRSVVIMWKDIFCGFGSAEACDSAKADRRVMIDESDELSRGDVGNRIRELLSGIDDPATLVAHEDEKRHGTPHLTRR